MKFMIYPVVGALLAGLLASQTHPSKLPEKEPELPELPETEVTEPEETLKENDKEEKPEIVWPADFSGRIFTFLTGGDGEGSAEFHVEELNGAIINDAKFARNIRSEEEHNFKLEEVFTEKVEDMARKATLAGDNFFAAVSAPYTVMAQLSSRGALVNMANEEFGKYINLDEPWWNASMIEDTAVLGNVHYASGAISLNDDNAATAILFNRRMVKELDIDPYKLVLEGTWTFDKFAELALMTTYDLDGDGMLLPENDIFGAASSLPFAKLLASAADYKPVSLDKDGKLALNINAEAVDAQSAILETVEKYVYPYVADDADEMFSTGRAAFYAAPIGEIGGIRRTEVDFGILPLPKSAVTQMNYSTY
nr:hypothetical protein [Clostridia bacterium]